MPETIEITVDDATILARPGESLAAAMTAAGIRAFRSTASGAERGIFCGMGVCEDCLVEVDGKPNRRACMTKVAGPHVVRREAHRRPLPPASAKHAAITIEDVPVERPGVLVIGAGPGGLSAAIAARRASADVLLVDERATAGGQYYKQIGVSTDGVAAADRQHRDGADLIGRALEIGVRFLPETIVWGAFEPQEFIATTPRGILRLLPERTIVATGAYERGWAVPGWTLPGVMTTGAAQTLWRTARRIPGKRVLIAGNGPLNLQLADELTSGGAQVVAIVETALRPGISSLAALARMALSEPQQVLKGLGYHRRRKKAGSDYLFGAAVTGIEQTDTGLRVTVACPTATIRYEVDALCMNHGFEPSNELLRALGCAHDYNVSTRQLVTRRDAQGRTNVEGVYALGDCTGLGGAAAALAEGTIVGAAAAADLGLRIDDALAADRQIARRRLRRHRRFQDALWQVFAPTHRFPAWTPDTIICRCEEVALSAVEEAMDEGLTRTGDIKRRTRAGMGRCQGRYCGPVLQDLVERRFQLPRDEFSGFAPRPPVKPVSLEDLARMGSLK